MTVCPTYSWCSSPLEVGAGRRGTVMKVSPERTVRMRRRTLLLLLSSPEWELEFSKERASAWVTGVEQKRRKKRRRGWRKGMERDLVMGFDGERGRWNGMVNCCLFRLWGEVY